MIVFVTGAALRVNGPLSGLRPDGETAGHNGYNGYNGYTDNGDHHEDSNHTAIHLASGKRRVLVW
jgi:hypothetical protein